MLAAMHGDVFIVPSDDWILAQDGITMMPAIVNGVLSVGKIVPDGIGEKFVLWRRRPVVMPHGVPFVQALHFLQEHYVGSDAAQPFPQVVDRHAPFELRESLVDVVSDDLEFFHFFAILVRREPSLHDESSCYRNAHPRLTWPGERPHAAAFSRFRAPSR